MRGLRRADLVILATLVPLWVVCEVFHVDRQLDAQPLAWVPIYVDTRDGLPVVIRLWDEVAREESGRLLPGDRILEVGDWTLAGASRLRLIQLSYLAAREGRVPYTIERNGKRIETSLGLRVVEHAWSHLVLSLALGASATLVLLRGRGSRVARAYSLAALAYSLHFCSLYGGPAWLTAFGLVLLISTGALYAPLMLRAALMFPESQAPRGWPRLLPWVFLVIGGALYVWIFGSPTLHLFGFRWASVCFVASITALLAIVTHHYVRAGARARRQMRWGLYGFFVGTVPVWVLSLVSVQRDALRPLYEASLVFEVAIPGCLFVALVKDSLFDVDRLITRTVAYTLLLSIFVGLAVWFLPGLAKAASSVSGIEEATLTPVFSITLGALLIGAGRPLHAHLLRWLAPESERLDRGVKQLAAEVASSKDSSWLLRTAGERLAELLALESCVLYARTNGSFEPVVVRGSLVDHAFAASGPLVATLQETGEPLRLWTFANRSVEAGWDSREREALHVVRAEILVPILHRAKLAAFLCLGQKRSGDIFTTHDLANLDRLAVSVSLELARYETSDLERSSRELSDAIADAYSCFLSYASADETFARKLHRDLETNGVKTWFAPESMRTGERWRRALDDGLAHAEKLLVVLSRASLASSWVGYEVEAALERDRSADEGRSVLFPVRIDDAILHAIGGWAALVRESVHVRSFDGWENETTYRTAFRRLLEDLDRRGDSPSARVGTSRNHIVAS
jgi:hypothetical protein